MAGDITCGMTVKDEKMTEQVLVRLKPSLAHVVDAWRLEQFDRPSRADAIRRLTALALKSAGMNLPEPDESGDGRSKSKSKKGAKS